jgi:hypothetical protein
MPSDEHVGEDVVNARGDESESTKKPYRTPTLTRYGNVEELTTQEGVSTAAGTIIKDIITIEF